MTAEVGMFDQTAPVVQLRRAFPPGKQEVRVGVPSGTSFDRSKIPLWKLTTSIPATWGVKKLTWTPLDYMKSGIGRLSIRLSVYPPLAQPKPSEEMIQISIVVIDSWSAGRWTELLGLIPHLLTRNRKGRLDRNTSGRPCSKLDRCPLMKQANGGVHRITQPDCREKT